MKTIRIKFSGNVDVCLNAVMTQQHSGLPKTISFKTLNHDSNYIRTMMLGISEEEDAFVTEQATNMGVSKAEMIETILETCFVLGITEQGKRWIVDTVVKQGSLNSKMQFVCAIIKFIRTLYPNSQKVQKTLAEHSVKIRGEKRKYIKSKSESHV